MRCSIEGHWDRAATHYVADTEAPTEGVIAPLCEECSYEAARLGHHPKPMPRRKRHVRR